MVSPVELSRQLIAFDTVNPPGNELDCINFLEALLRRFDFRTTVQLIDTHRANLIAEIGQHECQPLCFSGHVDTVPLGQAPWAVEPFAGLTKDGKIFGRGSSDMKCGIAAFVAAVCELSICLRESQRGVTLLITAGEELGCEGAIELAKARLVKPVGALVVAEPTANQLATGHKGALWMRAEFSGLTAHGSMPELGVNSIYKAARAISALEAHTFYGSSHPHLGTPTLNVGTINAGLNVNSVPDHAEITIDVRSVPDMRHRETALQISSIIEGDAKVTTLLDLEPVWTSPEHPWVKCAKRTVSDVRRSKLDPEISVVSYFTDASILKRALESPPTIILGPGEPSQAHVTNEFCLTERVNEAQVIYKRLISDYCSL